jgi:hypothetical protein
MNDAIEIAFTIMKQLGGNKFIVMTGARDFIHDKEGRLSFRFPTAKAGKSKGANRCAIALTGDDLFTMAFSKARHKTELIGGLRFGAGWEVSDVAKIEGLFSDQLQSVFTAHTGMDTHL